MIEDMRRHPDEVNFDEARANVYRILRPYEPSEDVMQVSMGLDLFLMLPCYINISVLYAHELHVLQAEASPANYCDLGPSV